MRGHEFGPAPRSDIFADHLQIPNSALRLDIDMQMRQRRREFATEDVLLERLIHRYPDFLDESMSDPWVVQNQALRFLNDWFLRARTQPTAYPGTNDFLSKRPVR